MKRGEKWMERILSGAGLPEENPGKLPLMEICCDRRVLIEHHLGIWEYSEDKIVIAVLFGTVIVEGTDLRICQMSTEKLIIRGKILCVHFERRKP